MRRRRPSAGNMATISTAVYLLLLCGAAQLCDGASRTSQRRKDTSKTEYLPSPSVETLKELAEAMGAAEFEHYTEGKALVKRLIPQNSEPDLDEISHQGVIGKAGVDFPAFPNIPPTGFNCKNVPTGYYADLETDCQVFHICDTSRKISFLCPNGTIFSQSHLICDWWFKVDCASAPALYESSAEYYSNEQKKTHKITQSLSKNSDLQQITDASNIKEKTQPIRRIPLPTTTERLSRHRQRVQNVDPLANVRATARSFHALYVDNNFSATQRTQATTPSSFDKRRKNLVQLIANNFGNTPTARTTLPSYTDSSTYRGDNSIKEMQVAAESASFTNNNNRQYLQDYNNKNYRPYPVYSPEINSRVGRTKTPTLTTLFVHDIRDKHFANHPTKSSFDFTTKRPTLLPYTKSYGNILNEKHEPYTRPGVHLLKDFLDREKNKTRATEKQTQVTERVDQYNTKPTYESVTKIPTTRSSENYFTQTASSDRFDVYSTNNLNQITTEPNYHERRERLIKKFNLGNNNLQPTEATLPTTAAEKLYGRKPGAILPPVLTPKTLHTLAIYYATAFDNLSTTTPPLEDGEATTTYMDQFEKLEDGLPALFSRHTINEYSSLFGQGDNSELFEELKFDPNNTLDINEDLSVQQSQNPLSTSPQIRELAQVFTHALSAYLQDPVKFRKVLSDIRPTHPSFGDMLTTTNDENLFNSETTTTVNEEDDEILGFSDDNKVKPGLAQLRDPKALNLATVQPRFAEAVTDTTPRPFTTEISSAAYSSTARPFRCCGRISASYTTSSTTKDTATTPVSFSNTFASRINTLAPNVNETYITTTENSYTIPRYSGFQNNSNSDPYGKNVKPINSKPINDYTEVTNLPTAWGVGNTETDATVLPNINSHYSVFESNRIKTTTTTALPPPTTDLNLDSESIELENDEELQRAHSQSFVTPQVNNKQRQGINISLEGDTDVNEKQTTVNQPSFVTPQVNNIQGQGINISLEGDTDVNEKQTTVKMPSFVTPQVNNIQGQGINISLEGDTDVNEKQTTVKQPSFELEAPTLPDDYEATTMPASPTTNDDEDDVEETTTTGLFRGIANNFQWSNSFENWHSTVILDPITLNDGLSATGPQQLGLSQLASQTPAWLPTQTTYYNTATTADYPSPVYTGGINQANEQAFSSSQTIELTTPASRFDSEKREGRLLKQPTSTSSSIDLTTIEDTVVEKAKEIMEGMNATTTEKLINVMKKTKSKTVRRLILLLVQTCDDDHNSTAEASKKALLDALMAVSQKDMDEVATEASVDEITTTSIPDVESNQFTNTHRRMDKIIDTNFRTRSKNSYRTGKSLGVDPSAVNSLTNPSSTESVKSTEIKIETTTANTTPSPFSRTTPIIRRGTRKFFTKTPKDNKIHVNPSTEGPKFEARIASKPSEEQKTPSDTRAVELLKSLYTIVARWG